MISLEKLQRIGSLMVSLKYWHVLIGFNNISQVQAVSPGSTIPTFGVVTKKSVYICTLKWNSPSIAWRV